MGMARGIAQSLAYAGGAFGGNIVVAHLFGCEAGDKTVDLQIIGIEFHFSSEPFMYLGRGS